MSPEVTARDLCASAVQSQRNLLADAKLSAARAGEARLDAELREAALARSVGLASQAASHDEARVAEVGNLRIKHELAVTALRQAVEIDESARQRIGEVEARLAEAERLFEIEQVRERRATGALTRRAKARAGRIVSAVQTIMQAMAEQRSDLAEDGAQVRWIGERGAVGDVPFDGLQMAGYLGEALLEVGGRMHIANPMEIKWACDLPLASSPLYNPIAATIRIVEIVAGSIEEGARSAKSGHPDRAIEPLREMSLLRTSAAHIGELRVAREEHEKTTAQEKKRADAEAHEARLRGSREKAEAMKGRSFLNGVPIPIRGDAPHHRPFPPGATVSPLDMRPAALPPELQGDVSSTAPPVTAPSPAQATPSQARKPAKPARNPLEPDEGGDYFLEGSADAPGGDPFPTSPVPGTPSELDINTGRAAGAPSGRRGRGKETSCACGLDHRAHAERAAHQRLAEQSWNPRGRALSPFPGRGREASEFRTEGALRPMRPRRCRLARRRPGADLLQRLLLPRRATGRPGGRRAEGDRAAVNTGDDLAAQVGPDVAPFLRWLVASSVGLEPEEVLDVLEDPHAWREEFRRFVLDRARGTAPSREECEGEERASR
jgi:hypothetical protein